MQFNKKEANADPPTKFECDECGDTFLSRCVVHPDSHGLCYKGHLDKDHRPEVEE